MDLNESFSSFNPEGDYQYYKENVPPGFRFDDTDDLIMLSYLRSKEQGHRLANIFFKQVSLYDYDPEELQSRFNNGKGDEMYFYTETKPLNNGWRVGRKAGNGRWKTKNGEKKITQGGETIGYKTTLSFYCGKEGKEKITCWNMREYKLRRENRKRKRGDDVVLCKIYKRGGAEKTSEAIDEENNEETGGSIGSCNYLQSSTTVSNGLGQSFPDVHSLECFETEDLVTPTNGSSDLSVAPVNDPFQFAVSPIEDSATPMNIVYEDFPILAEVDDPFQLHGCRHLNVWQLS